MTEKKANRLGWELNRGGYYGTNQDRADRWYWCRIGADVIDRRHDGYVTKKEALETLEELISRGLI